MTDTDPDRPRYRVLARSFTSLDPVDSTPQVVGYELTVSRVDTFWRQHTGDRAYEPIGTTEVYATAAGALDPVDARDTVIEYLRLLAEPLPCGVERADVELYLEVTGR